MPPTYKAHKAFCVEQITREEKLAEELNEILDRLTMYKFVNQLRNVGGEISFMNSDGTPWSKEGKDFVNGMTDGNPMDFDAKLEGLRRDLKLSTYKQKFWRYFHNLNYDKAKKYAEKSCELQGEILDTVMFEDKDAEILVCMTQDEGKEAEYSKNSNGVKVLGEEFKSWKELTASILKNFHLIPRK
jgi:hypothetical protein